MSKTDDPNIKFLVNEETINFCLFGHIILDWIICNTYGWLICNTYLVRSFNLLRRYFTQNISLNLWDKALYLAYAVVIRYTGLFLDSLWHQISPHKHTIAGRRSSIILTTNPIKITIAIHLKMSTLCKPQVYPSSILGSCALYQDARSSVHACIYAHHTHGKCIGGPCMAQV
jgi:hypothetical protein